MSVMRAREKKVVWWRPSLSLTTYCRRNPYSNDNRDDGAFLGDVVHGPVPDRNQFGQEYELPISKVQIKDVIQAVENLENKMKDNMFRNKTGHLPQYQVHEDVKEFFIPEQAVRENDEYIVESGTVPGHLLPMNLKPLTLQSVLRPNVPNGKPSDKLRAPFRRPAPPEIKLHRPTFHKVNNAYPLPLPNSHQISHGAPKKNLQKHQPNRPNPNVNRVPPGFNKFVPPASYGKPGHNQMPTKQIPKFPNFPNQPIVIGKPLNILPLPSQTKTLSLGLNDLTANQVVNSQMTLPIPNEISAESSLSSSFMQKPGQIILGRPMDNPVPLDQQMMSTKPSVIRITPVPASSLLSTTSLPISSDSKKKTDMKSSDFMGESTDEVPVRPAINTGFKPDSIVIESGFKPIIREPLMAEEDRITNDNTKSANRREDTDVEDDYDEAPQGISGTSNDRIPSDKMTESFEPIFIPSPPDHALETKDKSQEVFPHNHAKENRPHPVYVRTESELNALFGKKNFNKDVPSNMVMESNRVNAQYLPPDPKFPKEYSQKISTSDETFTTYDGKTVSASTLTSVPEVIKINKLISSKLPATSEDLLKIPQFGPFKGETPLSTEHSVTVLNKVKLPETQNTNISTTKSSSDFVKNKEGKTEDSLNEQVKEKMTPAASGEDEEYEDEFTDETESKKRRRREITESKLSKVKLCRSILE